MGNNATANQGHRARLLERFSASGIGALADYEIIELILTFAIPRRDTKPLAKLLVRRFRSVSGVLNADLKQLEQIEGVGRRTASLLLLFRQVMSYCLKEQLQDRPVIHHRKDVDDYLRFNLGFRRDEYVAALFLDNGNRVISTEVVTEGTVNQCAVYPRVIIEKALGYKASAFIIAHNHPGGSTEPSDADWQITERLHQLGKLMDLPLLDHIISVQERVVSLREMPRWPR
ncbi:MAG: RadC family protein [Chitinispirillaceae bacterium]